MTRLQLHFRRGRATTPMLRMSGIAMLGALLAAGCAGEPGEPGSAWGGSARLVALRTIGQAEGPPHLIFGRIADFALTSEHVYVLESQPPVIRKYTHAGEWVADLGRQGSGPGEFDYPTSMAVSEDAGVILVEHKDPTRLVTLGLEGEVLEPVRVEHWRGAEDLLVTDRGLARTVMLATGESKGADRFRRELVLEWRPLAGGPAVRVPLEVPEGMPPRRVVECAGGGAIATPVPFAPDFHWTPLRNGNWITGTSDAYRFTIHGFGDDRDRIVEAYWEPVEATDAERAWRLRLAETGAKCGGAGTEVVAGDAPRFKRAYEDLFDDGGGRVWVVREGPGREHPDCATVAEGPEEWRRRPCWTATRRIDVFSTSGVYLGPLEAPEALRTHPRPIAIDDRVLAVTLDADGIYRLTWYGWELPAGAGSS